MQLNVELFLKYDTYVEIKCKAELFRRLKISARMRKCNMDTMFGNEIKFRLGGANSYCTCWWHK